MVVYHGSQNINQQKLLKPVIVIVKIFHNVMVFTVFLLLLNKCSLGETCFQKHKKKS